MGLITLDQYVARQPVPVPEDQKWTVEELIDDASALVLDIVDDVTAADAWAADPTSVPAAIVPVVVAMVRRGLDNPHGFTSETQHGYSYRGASDAGVFATQAEARIIRDAASVPSVGVIHLTGTWS